MIFKFKEWEVAEVHVKLGNGDRSDGDWETEGSMASPLFINRPGPLQISSRSPLDPPLIPLKLGLSVKTYETHRKGKLLD